MKRRFVAGVVVLTAVAGTGVAARSADAATASWLTGTFPVAHTVTASTNQREPVGFKSTSVYAFAPACSSGPCTTALTRTRRDGTSAKYSVAPAANGDYRGSGDYLSACLSFDGDQVVAPGALATREVLTVRPTASTSGLITAFTGTLTVSFTPVAGAPADCVASTETLSISGSFPEQPPVFTRYPSGLAFPGPDGSADFTVQATSPTGLPVTLSWSRLPASPVAVTCVNTANPAAVAIVTCTVRGGPAEHNIRTVTFTATDQLGRTATREVRVGPPLYLAMGDSFASGEGAPPFEPETDRGVNSCHRSRAAGARIFAAAPGNGRPQLRNRLVACSGATIDAMASSFKSESPQYTALGRDVTLASVSIGGNDVGFATILGDCITAKHLRGRTCQGSTETTARRKLADLDVPDDRTGLTRLQTVYRRIQLNMAPGGRLLVVGYPRLFGPGSGVVPPGCGYVHKSDVEWINRLLDDGNAVIKRNAEAVDATYVDLAGPFGGHGLCDTRASWINGLRFTRTHGVEVISKESFHPNASGQLAIGTALSRAYLGAG